MMIHFGLENNIIATDVVVEVGGFWRSQRCRQRAADEWMEHGGRMANSPSAISAAASRKCQSGCLSAVATLALVRAKNDLLLPLRLPQGYQVAHANSNL